MWRYSDLIIGSAISSNSLANFFISVIGPVCVCRSDIGGLLIINFLGGQLVAKKPSPIKLKSQFRKRHKELVGKTVH